MAPDADRLLRPRRRRALPRRRPAAALRLGRRDVRRGRSAAADRRARARRQVQPHGDLHGVDARAGVGRHAGHGELRDRARDALRPHLRPARPARLVQAQAGEGGAAPASDPRGERGPRRARHGGGSVTTPMSRLTRRMTRPLLLATVCLTLVAALTGCGNRESEPRTFAETEGLYLELGDLEYQVQISRQLNPSDAEDADLLRGVSESVEPPTGEETWFGVFVRVANQTDEVLPVADQFEIHDANENSYEP